MDRKCDKKWKKFSKETIDKWHIWIFNPLQIVNSSSTNIHANIQDYTTGEVIKGKKYSFKYP